jgi:hypothetical protein
LIFKITADSTYLGTAPLINARPIAKPPELSSICILLGADENTNRRNPKGPSGSGYDLFNSNGRRDIGKGDPKIRIAFFT